jgi:DtxR family Mn-dependent transcriptional regulator
LDANDDLSTTMRDYLADIYRLSDRGDQVNDFVSTSTLADMLDVSAPAVNRMVTNLKNKGLLEHEPYQGIRLTESGKREALKELRRHRIAESFLVNVMGFGWHEVHEEANRMSGALSDILTERMAQMAGNPTRCPHGEPIPSADGGIAHLDDHLLSEVEEGGLFEVTRVRTRESDRLEYMAALGLTPGRIVQVLHRAPFNGPLQLKVGEEYRIIGHNLAELIRVKASAR